MTRTRADAMQCSPVIVTDRGSSFFPGDNGGEQHACGRLGLTARTLIISPCTTHAGAAAEGRHSLANGCAGEFVCQH